MKTALVTGCFGMDASYLIQLLLEMNYEVMGIARRKSTNTDNWGNLESFKEELKSNKRFTLKYGDITDPSFASETINTFCPDEAYFLGAQSHVAYSFENPVETTMTDAVATLYWLEAIRKYSQYTRIYFAATSELYGGILCPVAGYTEESLFYPRSPYACAKQFSYSLVNNYKDAYSLFACSGILFNHCSPRRGLDFVERKITSTVAKIKLGIEKEIRLGNMDAFRDLGHSKDYTKAMYLMLQQEVPDNFVIATGETHQIREILDYTCSLAGLKPEDILVIDQRFMRPSEVPYLLGNPAKAKKELGWKPTYTFEKLIEEMFINDYNINKRLI